MSLKDVGRFKESYNYYFFIEGDDISNTAVSLAAKQSNRFLKELISEMLTIL